MNCARELCTCDWNAHRNEKANVQRRKKDKGREEKKVANEGDDVWVQAALSWLVIGAWVEDYLILGNNAEDNEHSIEGAE